MNAEVIETEAATLIILWKPGSANAQRVRDSLAESLLPARAMKASGMWREGKQAREICKALRVPMKKYSAATEFIIRLRMLYGTEFFPYRVSQLNGLAAK